MIDDAYQEFFDDMGAQDIPDDLTLPSTDVDGSLVLLAQDLEDGDL